MPVWILLIWPIVLGASIGSFLNVLIWRLPQRLSILHPSRCPACRTPIKHFDNVPIFGWIWLKGKCRACTAPISWRYPLIEFITMLLICGLAWQYFSSGTADLLALIEGVDDWSGAGSIRVKGFLFHSTIACWLIVATMIGYDRQTHSCFNPLLLLVFTLSAPWWLFEISPPSTDAALNRLLASNGMRWHFTMLLGALVGGIGGWATFALEHRWVDRKAELYFSLICATVGALAGWQWVGFAVLTISLVFRIARWRGRNVGENAYVIMNVFAMTWFLTVAPHRLW